MQMLTRCSVLRRHAGWSRCAPIPLGFRHASLDYKTSSTALGRCITAPCSSQRAHCSTYASSPSTSGSDRPYHPHESALKEEHPIVQLPARSLWCQQYPLPAAHVRRGEFEEMISRLKAARRYYQYPSLCGPQIGWNVQVFTLFDGSVYINPVNLDREEWLKEAARVNTPPMEFEEDRMAVLRSEGKTCFAWEPCASCCFLMHYIERPSTVRLQALNEKGESVEVTLDKMRGRMALHEMDHLQGVLFTRRVVDADHVIPLEGFSSMSDWSDDFPSLEARSTFLYTTFTPPFHFITDAVEDANLLDRKFEDGIYPGCEHDRRLRIESAALEEIQREQWRHEKNKSNTDGSSDAAEEEMNLDGAHPPDA